MHPQGLHFWGASAPEHPLCSLIPFPRPISRGHGCSVLLFSPAPTSPGAAPRKGRFSPGTTTLWGGPSSSPAVMMSSIFFHTLYCSEPRYLATSRTIPEGTASGSSAVQAILGQGQRMEMGHGWRKGPSWVSWHLPGVLAGASSPAPHISQTFLSPQEGGESPQKDPSTKSPQYQGFNASSKTCNAALFLHVCHPMRHPGRCLALGTPSTFFCRRTQTQRGHVGMGTRLGQRPHSAARQETPLCPREGMRGVLSRPEHPVSPGRGCGGDRDLPALAVLVGLKEKETPGIRLRF